MSPLFEESRLSKRLGKLKDGEVKLNGYAIQFAQGWYEQNNAVLSQKETEAVLSGFFVMKYLSDYMLGTIKYFAYGENFAGGQDLDRKALVMMMASKMLDFGVKIFKAKSDNQAFESLMDANKQGMMLGAAFINNIWDPKPLRESMLTPIYELKKLDHYSMAKKLLTNEMLEYLQSLEQDGSGEITGLLMTSLRYAIKTGEHEFSS